MSRIPRRGFNLVELLVATLIVVIMIGLFLPATRRVRDAAGRTQCTNNLKQLMLAMHCYNDATGKPSTSSSLADVLADDSARQVHSDVLRPGHHAKELLKRHFPPGCTGPGQTPEARLSWLVTLLPYLEQDTLHRQFKLDKGYADNFPPARTVLSFLICPDSHIAGPSDAVTTYVAMSGVGLDAAARPAGAVGNGFMGYDRLTKISMMTDGTSFTVALLETRHDVGPWAQGGTTTLRGFDPVATPLQGAQAHFGCHDGMVAGMGDGSVRFFRATIDPTVLAAGLTIAGGETVNLD